MFDEFTYIQSLLNSVWPDWKVTRRLGKGSYGAVYEILRDDLGTGYRCALKVLQMHADISDPEPTESITRTVGLGHLQGPRSQTSRPSGTVKIMQENRPLIYPAAGLSGHSEGELEDFVRDVCNEIDLMIRLKGAPHIVSIEDYAVLRKYGERTILIRMEKLESISSMLSRGRCRDRSEVIRLGMDICSALEYCHQKNILHRDIKPGNIFYIDRAGFKLGDFGISRTMASVQEKMSMSGVGSPRYMAPEVYFGRQYDNTADIYSLGLTLYELLNDNYPPFYDRTLTSPGATMDRAALHSANMRRLRGEPLPPPSNADMLLAEVIRSACSPDPDRRFRSASAFKIALSECMDPDLISNPDPIYGQEVSGDLKTGKKSTAHTGQAGRQPVPPEPPEKPSKAPYLVLAAAALLIVVVIVRIFTAQDRIPKGSVGYTVIYKDSAVGKSLSSNETASGNIGEEITLPAKDIPGYRAQQETETIVLQKNPVENVVVFLYEEEPAEALQTKNLQEEISQAENPQTEISQAENPQTDNPQTEISQSEASQTGNNFEDSSLESASLPLPDDRIAIDFYVSGIAPNKINLRSEPKHESDLVISTDENTALYFFGETGRGEGSDHKEHTWYHVMVQPGVWGYARSDYAKKISPDELSTGRYLFPTDTAVITDKQLSSLTRIELILIRSEIYARHGYVFSDRGLQDFFTIRTWYKPDRSSDPSSFDYSVLNEYEQRNLEKILAYESSRGWR